jgi:hypothetical protein
LPDIPLIYRCMVTLAFIAMVIALSIVPGRAEPGDSVFSWLVVNTAAPVQKTMHVAIYAALVVLWMWTLEAIGSRALRALLSVLLAIGLGALLEWGQLYVAGRFGTLSDVILNGVGALLGLVLAIVLL